MKFGLIFLVTFQIISAAGLMDKNFFLFGIEKSFVTRIEETTAGGEVVSTAKPSMSTFNYNIGFYRPLYRDFLSLRVYGTLGSGEGSEIWSRQLLTVSDGNGSYLYERHNLRIRESHSFMGVSPELILYKRFRPTVFPYFFAGVSINSNSMSQSVIVEDESALSGQTIPMENATTSLTCFHLATGAGWVFFPTYYLGFFFEYKFKYWNPVDYKNTAVDAVYETTETHYCSHAGGGAIFRF